MAREPSVMGASLPPRSGSMGVSHDFAALGDAMSRPHRASRHMGASTHKQSSALVTPPTAQWAGMNELMPMARFRFHFFHSQLTMVVARRYSRGSTSCENCYDQSHRGQNHDAAAATSI